jgi:hypothetical protein
MFPLYHANQQTRIMTTRRVTDPDVIHLATRLVETVREMGPLTIADVDPETYFRVSSGLGSFVPDPAGTISRIMLDVRTEAIRIAEEQGLAPIIIRFLKRVRDLEEAALSHNGPKA